MFNIEGYQLFQKSIFNFKNACLINHLLRNYKQRRLQIKQLFTLRTWAFFISIFILGILTLSNAKNPLLVEFIPNLLPISPIFIPNVIDLLGLLFLRYFVNYFITRHWHPCFFISKLNNKRMNTITLSISIQLSHYNCIITRMSN